MGYDEPRSLGGREFGSTLAMPIWVDYMRVALAKVPPQERVPPEDVVNDGVDWIYPEFIDAEEERTIDIVPLPDPSASPEGGLEGQPETVPGTLEEGAPGALPLPSVAPPAQPHNQPLQNPPAQPAPAPAATPATTPTGRLRDEIF